jgi:hypothetical protein
LGFSSVYRDNAEFTAIVDFQPTFNDLKLGMFARHEQIFQSNFATCIATDPCGQPVNGDFANIRSVFANQKPERH